MEQKNEGICRFCLKTLSGSAMSRHLLACKTKKEKDEQEMAKAKTKYPIYYLKLSSYKDYWLHVEMKAASTLRELDDFLRRIWLECCGHLSMFTINGVEYEDTEEQGDFDDFWRRNAASLDTSLVKAMNVGDKFDYEYDFCSNVMNVTSQPLIIAPNVKYFFVKDASPILIFMNAAKTWRFRL